MGKGKGGGLSFASSDVAAFHRREEEPKESEPPRQAQGWLFSGRRVRTQGLVYNAELNGVKGTLVEETEPGVWAVLLDDGHGEKRLRAQNLTTLSGAAPGEIQMDKATGAPTTADAKVAKKMATSTISITGSRDTQSVEPQPDLLCIAGTWDDWMPQDMQWDAQHQCHTFKVALSGTSEKKFGVNRGKAGTKKWAVRPKQWSMGRVAGCFLIKVFMRNRLVDNVEWEKLA